MYSKVKYFLKDDDFINYVMGVTAQSAFAWESYFKEHPEEEEDAERAKEILLGQVNVTSDLTATERRNLKDRIISSIKDFSGSL